MKPFLQYIFFECYWQYCQTKVLSHNFFSITTSTKSVTMFRYFPLKMPKMPKMTIHHPAYVSQACPYVHILPHFQKFYIDCPETPSFRHPHSGQKVQDPAQIRVPLRSRVTKRHRWNFANEEWTQGHLHSTAKHRCPHRCLTTVRQWGFKTDKTSSSPPPGRNRSAPDVQLHRPHHRLQPESGG